MSSENGFRESLVRRFVQIRADDMRKGRFFCACAKKFLAGVFMFGRG
jgi:hypothetical protein